jgi:hypothetical protein
LKWLLESALMLWGWITAYGPLRGFICPQIVGIIRKHLGPMCLRDTEYLMGPGTSVYNGSQGPLGLRFLLSQSSILSLLCCPCTLLLSLLWEILSICCVRN